MLGPVMRPQQNMQVKTLIVYSVSVSSGIKKKLN